MDYVWDRRKNLRNVRLHAIAFEDAVQIFEGPTLEKFDDRFDYGETRVYAIGLGFTPTFLNPNEGSFRHGDRKGMKEKPSGKVSAKRSGTEWARLRKRSDTEIRSALNADPDVRPTDANFWKKATVVLPQTKQSVTMRLDADLLAWFRRQKGYQTRINAVLRTYMDAHKQTAARTSEGDGLPRRG